MILPVLAQEQGGKSNKHVTGIFTETTNVLPNGKLVAVPDDEQRKKSEPLVREIFADDYRDATPSGQRVLADKLMQQAEFGTDEPAIRFVLFEEARRLAISAKEMSLSLTSVQREAQVFKIDAMHLDLDILTAFAPQMIEPADCESFVETGISLMDSAAQFGQLDVVESIRSLLESVAHRSNNSALEANIRNQAESLKKTITELTAAHNVLATNPNDPQANRVLGLYYCFTRGDWPTGLKYLQRTDEAALRDLATKELQNPTTGDAAYELGGQWYDYAQNTSAIREQALSRSAYWYRLALPKLQGLKKQLAEKRGVQQGTGTSVNAASNDVSSFFGIETTELRIVYLCDSSGSMMNVFGQLKTELAKSIDKLSDKQSFNVLFFADTDISAFDKHLQPATSVMKRKAIEFMGGMSSHGGTDPIIAIKAAFDQKPQMIYVLTDGFDQVSSFDEVIQTFRKLNHGKQVKVNFIYLRPPGAANEATLNMKKVLQTIARENKGIVKIVDKSGF